MDVGTPGARVIAMPSAVRPGLEARLGEANGR
jgi:hypothetical protein